MADAFMPFRDVIKFVQEVWDAEGMDAETAANLFQTLAVRLLDKVQGHPDSAGITVRDEPVAAEVVTPGTEQAPYSPGDEVWTRTNTATRLWFVDQSGAFVEGYPDANEYGLTPAQAGTNEQAAAGLLEGGRITVDEFGDVVRGLHKLSPYRGTVRSDGA